MPSTPKQAPEGYRADYYTYLKRLDRATHQNTKGKTFSVGQQSGQPKGFWSSIIYDYIAKNPGCSQNAAANSLAPHRGPGLGLQIIKRLIEEEVIIAFRGPRSFMLYIKDHNFPESD